MKANHLQHGGRNIATSKTHRSVSPKGLEEMWELNNTLVVVLIYLILDSALYVRYNVRIKIGGICYEKCKHNKFQGKSL
jgi:hypothetical protein